MSAYFIHNSSLATGAQSLCKRFGGWFHFEKNEETFVERDVNMMKVVQAVSYKNKPNPRCAKRLFVGFDDEAMEGIWVVKESNKRLLNFQDFFQPGQPNGARKQNVAGFHFGTSGLPGMGAKQFDDGGSSEKHCFMCQFTSYPRLKMRGLCKQKMIDTFYTLLYDNKEQIPFYRGYQNTVIKLEENLDTKGGHKFWQIFEDNTDDAALIGFTEMIPDESSLATGLKMWTFLQPICGDKEQMLLEFSTCNDDEFTCKSDGECVAMKNRCDKYPNCADFSDEDNCETVIMESSYEKDFAPLESFNETVYKRTEVYVKVDLISIMEISEVDELMEAKFRLSLAWSDFRLTFHNLKEATSMNTLTGKEKSNIWAPVLVFLNTKDMEVAQNDEASFIEIQKKSNATINSFEENENIHIFKGRESVFSMKRIYSVKWICSYSMQWYPFDTQSCSMEFRPEGNSDVNIKLFVDSLKYEGPQDLAQYFIRNHSMIFRDHDESIVITVILGRRLVSINLKVFIPTLIMVIMSQASNYFKPFFFETVIQTNVTIMLVLVTMFLAISEGLPTTSYVKMIDLWFIMVLLVPFVYVLLHTYMDMLRVYKDKNENSDEEENTNLDMMEEHEDKNGNSNNNDKTITIKSPVFKIEKNNKMVEGMYNDLNLVSVDEKAQGNALKKFYEDIDAQGKDIRLIICLKVTKVGVPILIGLLMTIYWMVGLMKFYEMV